MSRRLLACVPFVLTLFSLAIAKEDPKGPDKAGKGEETLKGMIAKVDPSAHKLTITLEDKKAANKSREVDIGAATRFIFGKGADKKELIGKAAYKDERLAEGAPVTILLDGKGKLVEVRVGEKAKKDNKPADR